MENKVQRRRSPFTNDPFSMVAEAFDNLYAKPYEAWFDQHGDGKHENEFGFTEFREGQWPLIVIFAEHGLNIQIETFAHELAHVAVGIEHEHDAVWEAAFDKIFQEYNRLGDERFGQSEPPAEGKEQKGA